MGRTDAKAEAEAPILWKSDVKGQLIGKDPDTGKDWKQQEKVAEDKMVRWYHWPDGHEFEQTWELVKDREAWCAAAHEIAKCRI